MLVAVALVAGGLTFVVPALPAVAVGPTALINGSTVVDSSDQPGKSDEQIQAEADGFTVTVVDGATWDAMTEAQFRAYDVLIVGDPECNDAIDPSVLSNVATWTSAVMHSGGKRFTIASDPVFHSGTDSTSNRNHIIKDGIAFAGAQPGATGAYVDTSCDFSSDNTTILDDLSLSGSGWSVEQPACAGNIGIVASNSAFADTSDADLSDWFCSSHADYPAWASDWVPFAVSADAPTQNYCANDIETGAQVCGEPYILVAGSGVTVSSDISLSPATASNPVGTSHTVTATVVKNGVPEAGKTVTFTISAGPNAGKTGTGVTDLNGQTSFTYTDTGGAGTDTIVASFTDDSGRVQQATAAKTWVGESSGTTLTYTGPTTADYHDAFTATATLTTTSPVTPVPGQPVRFQLGSVICTTPTNAAGVASCGIIPSDAAGPYSLSVSFAGTAGLGASSTSATFTITKEETALTYTGATHAANGSPVTLAGVLQEDGTTPISGRTVTFTVGTGGSAQSCSGTTDATGAASCSLTFNQPGILLSVPVSAVFAGDAFYLPASASSTITVVFMTGRAYGLFAAGLLNIKPTPDTGPVVTTGPSVHAPKCVLGLTGLINAGVLCASVVTTSQPDLSTAQATVASVRIGLPGVPLISLTGVQASSATTCATSGGSTTIASLKVGTLTIISSKITPKPNSTLTVAGITIVLNAHIPVAGASRGTTVNAVEIIIPGVETIVVSSATSDIHNC